MFGFDAFAETAFCAIPDEGAAPSEFVETVSSYRLDLVYLVEIYPYQPETT